MRKFVMMFAVLGMVSAASATYASSLDEAKTYVNDVGNQALKIITDTKDKDAKADQLEKLFASSVDIPWVGKFVMGRYWRQADEEQKKTYLRAYEEFLVSHYAGRFAEYSGGSFEVIDGSQDEDGNFVVNMKIVGTEKQEVLVNYRLHNTDGGKLKIFDVIVEGVSLISTQRSEFASVLDSKGLDYLIEQLTSKKLAPPKTPAEKE